jgi:hypothetical protein
MSLKQFRGEANPDSNLMTKHGIDVMNYTQNGSNKHLDSSKNLYVVQYVWWPRCIIKNNTIESSPTLIRMHIIQNLDAPHMEWPMPCLQTRLPMPMDRRWMSAWNVNPTWMHHQIQSMLYTSPLHILTLLCPPIHYMSSFYLSWHRHAYWVSKLGFLYRRNNWN